MGLAFYPLAAVCRKGLSGPWRLLRDGIGHPRNSKELARCRKIDSGLAHTISGGVRGGSLLMPPTAEVESAHRLTDTTVGGPRAGQQHNLGSNEQHIIRHLHCIGSRVSWQRFGS